MLSGQIHNSAELIELIDRIGFLPLLDCGIRGFCAEDVVDEDCRYVVFADGGWDWRDKTSRSTKEMTNKSSRPAIVKDLNGASKKDIEEWINK